MYQPLYQLQHNKNQICSLLVYITKQSHFENLDVLLYFRCKWTLRQSLLQKVNHGYVTWYKKQRKRYKIKLIYIKQKRYKTSTVQDEIVMQSL